MKLKLTHISLSSLIISETDETLVKDNEDKHWKKAAENPKELGENMEMQISQNKELRGENINSYGLC